MSAGFLLQKCERSTPPSERKHFAIRRRRSRRQIAASLRSQTIPPPPAPTPPAPPPLSLTPVPTNGLCARQSTALPPPPLLPHPRTHPLPTIRQSPSHSPPQRTHASFLTLRLALRALVEIRAPPSKPHPPPVTILTSRAKRRAKAYDGVSNRAPRPLTTCCCFPISCRTKPRSSTCGAA